MRKRVIVTGDTSTANSGFAAYKKFLLNGLLESGRFDVAEVGNGGHVEDKAKVPWKYYPTGVKPGDKRYQQYISSPSNEYGAWRWEKICLDFKPTHTVSCDDTWQISHMITSPLKPYYHSLYSPTVDSIPQRVDFLQIFSQVDTLLAYTEWAKDYLNSVGLPCLDYIGMGIDPDVMKPLNKKELRRKYNLPEDAIIFGFVGRNQMRKRFPDIIESFARYLKRVPEDIAKRSFLYFHTSHIDQGWNIAESLIEHGVINKVYFTYICQATQKIFCSTFKGERCYSPYSRQLSATAPNVIMSPPLNILNEIYNLFDYYLQPATCFDGKTPILTIDGWKNIKDINEGDYVYTHKNRFRKVLTRYENPAPKTIYKIKCYGQSEPLLVTGEHKLYISDGNTAKWVCAQDLTTDHYFVRPNNLDIGMSIDRLKMPNDILSKYDTVSTFNATFKNKFHDQVYNLEIPLNRDFCRFIGLFAADGSASGSEVKITSHVNEDVCINLANSVFKTLGSNVKIHNRRKGNLGHDAIFMSKKHSIWFRNLFYTTSHDKKLPDWYLNIPKPLQKEILYGLFLGDGYSVKRISGKNNGYFCTTSPILAQQVQDLLINNHYTYGLSKCDRAGRKTMYRFFVNNDIKNNQLIPLPSGKAKNRVQDSFYLLKIKSIEIIDYKQDVVYDLEVDEDHTYMNTYGICSNCEGQGYPQLEAAASNIPLISTDYSAMTEMINVFGGLGVKPGTLNYEHGVMARRASMDIDGWANAMVKYALEKPVVNSRDTILQRYTWGHIIDKWIYYIDRADPPKYPWNAPLRQYQPPKLEGNLTATQFIDMLSRDVPQLNWSILNLLTMKNLNNQMELNGKHMHLINPDVVINRYNGIINNINVCEQIRCGLQPLEKEDFLE